MFENFDMKVIAQHVEGPELKQQFWKRCLIKYISNRKRRLKWLEHVETLKPGHLLLIVYPEYTGNCWHIARIEILHKTKDG